MLPFRHPVSFVAGNLPTCLDQCDQIHGLSTRKRISYWPLLEMVWMCLISSPPLTVTFKAKLTVEICFLARVCFPNSVACHHFKECITATIKDRICNGSINVIGRVSLFLTYFTGVLQWPQAKLLGSVAF